jgi:purine-nucleoside phosphorylase
MTNPTAWEQLSAVCRASPPQTVLVLGSGLGAVAQRLQPLVIVPFADIPGLPSVSVGGHAGVLMLGEWVGRRVLLFAGRLHYYEGHPWEVVVRPIQLAATLGVRQAVLTNAAGGIADHLEPGCLMAIRDHLQWTHPHWWRRPGPGGLSGSRPSPYSAQLRTALHQAATAAGVELHEGIYAAVTGPAYETPAEVRALRAWSADAVGMSTAREIQAGVEAGLECAAISCITNRAAGLSSEPLSHEDVLSVASRQAERLATLLERFLRSG